MYRVHGHDGNLYEVPSLAVLQQYVDEHRVIKSTIVEDLLSGATMTAEGVEGLRWTQEPIELSDLGPQLASADMSARLVLAKAIFATIVCCSPVAVYAVILAAKVPEILAQGDEDRAKRTMMKAHLWANLGMLAGIIWLIVVYKFGLLKM